MSFINELSTMLKRAGMVVPEDFAVYDSGADRINSMLISSFNT